MTPLLEVARSPLEMSYAPYVIASYAIFLVVLIWDALAPWLRHRRLLRQIRLKARRDAAKQNLDE